MNTEYPGGGCIACREEGYSRLLLPGMLVKIDGTSLRVERCDFCGLYESDSAAFQALIDAAERELLPQ